MSSMNAQLLNFVNEMVEVGNDQENAQSERNSQSKNRDGKTKLTIRFLYLENIL